jgi:DNA-binding NarL/FixJ family response regulator
VVVSKVVDDSYGLGRVADEIDGLQTRLLDAYASRVEAILEAMADGHSLREIAEHLRISHTAVAKALDGV